MEWGEEGRGEDKKRGGGIRERDGEKTRGEELQERKGEQRTKKGEEMERLENGVGRRLEKMKHEKRGRRGKGRRRRRRRKRLENRVKRLREKVYQGTGCERVGKEASVGRVQGLGCDQRKEGAEAAGRESH